MEEKVVEKDTLASLFESMDKEVFSEEIQLKISTLFESTIAEAVAAKEVELQEANDLEMKTFKEELVVSVDQYLEHFTTNYVKENEIVVEDFAKVKLAEKVLRNFKQMVEAFNVSLSEDSVANDNEVEGLKEETNKLHNQLIEAKQTIEDIKRAALIAEASIGGTDLQLEKFAEAAGKLDFETPELFEGKLASLLEKILKEGEEEVTPDKLDEQEEVVDAKKVISEGMEKYMKYLKKK